MENKWDRKRGYKMPDDRDDEGLLREEGDFAQFTLDLSGRDLIDIPETLLDTDRPLTTLDLTNNRIQEIPEWFFSINSLEHIFLGYNRIEELSVSVKELSNLKTLSVKRNKLTEIPREISSITSLHSLNISHNRIRSLPRDLGYATQLQELIIYGNPLEVLPETFSNLQATRIDVDDARLLVPAFSKAPNLMLGMIHLPREIQVPIQQYLQFFSEYYEMLHQRKISFEVVRRDNGIEVQYTPSSQSELESVTQCLQDFVSFVSASIPSENTNRINPNHDLRRTIVEKELRTEIQILKMRLESRDFNLKLMQETNMTLSEAVRQLSSRSTPVLIQNNISQTVGLYRTDPQYASILDRLESSADSLKAISRDSELENEVEKLKAQIREAKNAPDKESARSMGVASAATRFAEKLRDANTSLGKIAKGVEGARDSVSSLYEAARDLFTFLTGA